MDKVDKEKAKPSVYIEDGVVIGTSSNKYETKNPIGQWLLANFDSTIQGLVKQVNPSSVFEVGCGEGHITKLLCEHTKSTIVATDISEYIIREASSKVDSSRVSFRKESIYDINVEDSSDLVVCCEVLEHLEDPEKGLECLAKIASPYCLMSVPREPIFRSLNFIRGAYISDFGNSPGHLQHWSRRGFLKFVSNRFEVLQVKTPLPWTVLLTKKLARSD